MAIAAVDSELFVRPNIEAQYFDIQVDAYIAPDEQALHILANAAAEMKRVTLLKQLHLEQYGQALIEFGLIDQPTLEGLTEQHKTTIEALKA